MINHSIKVLLFFKFYCDTVDFVQPFIYNEIEKKNDYLILQWDPETELKAE